MRVGDSFTAGPLQATLADSLAQAGYADVINFNLVDGFSVISQGASGGRDPNAVLGLLGLTASQGRAAAGIDALGAALERLVGLEGEPVALVIDFASRLAVRPEALSPVEHHLFSRALVLAQAASARPVGAERSPLFNTILWVVDKEGDLPDWLTINNPRLRHIPIATPDRAVRRAIAPQLLRGLSGGRDQAPQVLAAAEDELVDGTEGLLLMDLSAITQLARAEGVRVENIGDAIRRYKVGVTEDAWKKIEPDKIRGGEAFIARRVIGQEHAVTHMLDIVKRAATGLSGSKRSGRPRGVAFLAGPTGVGKTELAKSVTELLFGDETAYIRFDMSEFSAEHADQRLIGAPPGYVGYDVGGELTNAVRERPFSVVLFDEIEKAHPRILDKFLQILDDGVLTSGRGDKVYFSEALIVFTSNLGVYRADESGGRVANVGPGDPFEQVQARLRSEIEVHFKQVLNRPEILNRIGENIIVFDFIRSEIGTRIFEAMVAGVLADAAAVGHVVSLSPKAQDRLLTLCTADLSNGGRGIRNMIEAHLINPLARALFDAGRPGPFVIADVVDGPVSTLVLKDGA
ncbi:ATP-dependent Clp protease ATP-binding subunit [Caulobacter vibrioides]|nr:ATP-dependent Clp protease ATP-binding subunit [Caulobacter vibrioides]